MGAIFDLDGVLVDTAIFHYMAWKEIADELQIPFSDKDNERLKGVSRRESLSILLSLALKGSINDRVFSKEERLMLSERKNNIYVDKLKDAVHLTALPGVLDTLSLLQQKGIKTAIGSSSKNAQLIIGNLGLTGHFDAVVDGRHVRNTKPDPEVFMLAARELGLLPCRCIVFEDAAAGVEAAKSAGMYCVGIGLPENLKNADSVMPGMEPARILDLFS